MAVDVQGNTAVLSKIGWDPTHENGTTMNRTQKQITEMLCALAAVVICGLLTPDSARAEYGDVVINNYSDKAGVRPVVFPHWFHRARFTCKVCHADMGFKFRAGGNEINMLKIIDGQYCGACHNGDVAWSIENCNLCHSGKPGTPTQVHEAATRPTQPPAAPPSSPSAKPAAAAPSTPATAPVK
jgi:c(7)-type cytochrome triheme protein